MKKTIAFVLVFCLMFSLCGFLVSAKAVSTGADFDVDCRSAVLMEARTGTVLYKKNEGAAYSPASVTKIMTILLVMEALDSGAISLNDTVSISDKAASMGGSQVFLEEGEEMSVEELLKCTVIASANDAALALAEFVAGSEGAFVARMNERARELGMESASFENVTGLDDTTENHVCSAMDIAIMSRELIRHETVLNYTTLWQDTIRGGEFTLTNTNRLVRYYDGCNGLKTGSTAKAGYCISASAVRGNLQLIAVVMGAENRDTRNAIARELLDYGFSAYALFEVGEELVETVPVRVGADTSAPLYSTPFCAVVEKGKLSEIERVYEIPEALTAPVKAGESLGSIRYLLGGELIGKSELLVKADLDRLSFGEILRRMWCNILFGS